VPSENLALLDVAREVPDQRAFLDLVSPLSNALDDELDWKGARPLRARPLQRELQRPSADLEARATAPNDQPYCLYGDFTPSTEVTPSQLKSYLESFQQPTGWSLGSTTVYRWPALRDPPLSAGYGFRSIGATFRLPQRRERSGRGREPRTRGIIVDDGRR